MYRSDGKYIEDARKDDMTKNARINPKDVS